MKKKIKIIDILCYISIGDYDKLPKRIEYQGIEYIFDEDDYKTYKGANLLDDACLTRYITSSMLNDFVKVLDEEDEFTDIVEWGEPALEEVKTKTDYTIKDLQRYIYILMQTQNDLTKNQKKIIERLKDE